MFTVVLLVAFILVAGATAEKCPDGSAGLTRQLYETGNPSQYADVTCIPSYEFQSYTGDVTLNEGLAFLNSIEDYAFHSFNGTLTISGRFPRLSSIGEYAFHYAGNYNAKIEIG